MALPSTLPDWWIDGALKACEDACVFGQGFLKFGKHIPYDDVFRFRFIPGKSHSHSRKVWRERRQRAPVSIRYTNRVVVEDLPEIDPAIAARIREDMAGSIDRSILAMYGLRAKPEQMPRSTP